MTRFEDTLRLVEDVEGWLTDEQARRLWERASAVAPPGRIVEIGSYRGRSAIVLASAARPGVSVIAVDPHAGNDRGPRQIEGSAEEGEADHRAFRANIERAGVNVEHLRLTSLGALEAVTGFAQLVYVDGAHRLGPARADLAGWGARVAPGGVLLVHDAWSSVGVSLALLSSFLVSGRFRYEGRTGSLAEYVRADVRGFARAWNAVRQLGELPWFARNLLRKAAIVARLRRGPWPY